MICRRNWAFLEVQIPSSIPLYWRTLHVLTWHHFLLRGPLRLVVIHLITSAMGYDYELVSIILEYLQIGCFEPRTTRPVFYFFLLFDDRLTPARYFGWLWATMQSLGNAQVLRNAIFRDFWPHPCNPPRFSVSPSPLVNSFSFNFSQIQPN